MALDQSRLLRYLQPPEALLISFYLKERLWHTDSDESVMRIGGNTDQLTDSGESIMRIGGITGQLTDSGKSDMRIGG